MNSRMNNFGPNCCGTLFLSLILFIPRLLDAQSQERIAPIQSNVSYGSDPNQILDYYLSPSSTNITHANITRVLLLIHGGGWRGGSKSGMYGFIPFLLDSFPNVLVANMDYRLGTWDSPGYPKQPEDIGSAIKFIKHQYPGVARFVLLGGSAGAHLALYYAYRYDREKQDVAMVIDVVGPTDFSDLIYILNPLYRFMVFAFTGPYLFYWTNRDVYDETSPVNWVSERSPITIGFYGNEDFYVPTSQAEILKKKLDSFGVVNEFNIYNGGHMSDWSREDKSDMKMKIIAWLNKYFMI